jgi:hypothetical protein
MTGERPFLMPQRIRGLLAGGGERTRCAVGNYERVVDAAQGRAWIQAVIAALPVQSKRGR